VLSREPRSASSACVQPRSSNTSAMVSPGEETQSGEKEGSVMVVPDEYDLDGCNPLPIGRSGRLRSPGSLRLEDQPLTSGQVERELPGSVPGQRMRAARHELGHRVCSLKIGKPPAEFSRTISPEDLHGLPTVRAQLLKLLRSEIYVHDSGRSRMMHLLGASN